MLHRLGAGVARTVAARSSCSLAIRSARLAPVLPQSSTLLAGVPFSTPSGILCGPSVPPIAAQTAMSPAHGHPHSTSSARFSVFAGATTFADDPNAPAATARVYSPRENAVLSVLCSVKHPEDGVDIVLRSMVRDVVVRDGVVSIALVLDQHYRALKKAIDAALMASPLSATVAAAPNTDTSSSSSSSPSSSTASGSASVSSFAARSAAIPFMSSKLSAATPPTATALATATATANASRPATHGWLHTVRVSIAPASDAELAALSPSAARRVGTTVAAASAGGGGHRQGAITSPGAVGPRGLAKVKNVIAVSSGKGGVGKSTVAVNLAYALAALSSGSANSTSMGSDSGDGAAAESAGAESTALPVRVGILDADIHGPSLPVMTSPALRRLREFKTEANDSLIEPLVYEGVKLMSYGFVPPSRVILAGDAAPSAAADGLDSPAAAGSAAIMRGPMVAQLVNELATRTHWGELDYLVIDMPPGTGDIALTLTQNVKITGAVVVTTPQKLAFVDVAKGVELFDKTRVPVLAVVENMAYYAPPAAPRERHFLFGSSQRFVSKLRAEWGLSDVFQLPVVPQVAAQGDAGEPFVLAAQALLDKTASETTNSTGVNGSTNAGDQQSKSAGASSSVSDDGGFIDVFTAAPAQVAQARDVYADLAALVAASCAPEAKARRARLDYNIAYSRQSNEVVLIPQQHQQLQQALSSGTASESAADAAVDADTAGELVIDPRELRLACKCAACVHEWTGQPLLKPRNVPQDVSPKTFTPRGQYAVAVTWSDGHQASMYPWTQLLGLAKKRGHQQG